MEPNSELRTAWDFVEHTGRSIFLTGKAGTGKTTFLKTVVEKSKKRTIVVAPTGVAAINAGGVTIHSFFQLPFSPYVPNSTIKNKFEFSKDKRRIMASIDLLIIDEISMVRADLLDAVDSVLRRFRDRFKPFGGVQLLMIGDLAQLTPVVTPEEEQMLAAYYDTPYFFGSRALAQTDYVTIQLEKVYRQQDSRFVSLLNHIREGKPTAEDLALLNSRVTGRAKASPPDSGGGQGKASAIRLTTHNQLANFFNDSELAHLAAPPFVFTARIEGTFPEYNFPTSPTLTLKRGAQVMFVKNDPTAARRYYNGRIGFVTYLDKSKILVHCEGDEKAIEVEPLEWENTKYVLNDTTREIEAQVQGRFVQYPLRLAWAITIHKSQGLTFDRAIIDARQSFAPGQVYVALSRLRSLEGLWLASPLEPRSIMIDKQVDSYIGQQEVEARKSIEQLPRLKEEYHRNLLLELFDFTEIYHLEGVVDHLMTEFLYHSHRSLTMLHRETVASLSQRVVGISEKWRTAIGRTATVHLHEEAFLERVRRSASYFEQELDNLLTKPIVLTREVRVGNKQAMKRITEALANLHQAWLARRYLLTRMATEGFTIATYLHEKQLSLLDAMDEKKVKAAKKKKKETEKTPPKPPKEKTWEITLRMFGQGKSPSDIARERQLATSTIFSHLEHGLEAGVITMAQIVAPQRHQIILQAMEKAGDGANLTSVKELCPPDMTYEEIRMVVKHG